MKKRNLVLILVMMIILISSCSQATTDNATKGPITVATMIDSEGAILGNMLLLLMEDSGFEVENKIGFGTPDILRKALESNEVDLVVDYTGSGQYYGAVAAAAVWSDPQLGYEAVQTFDKETNNIEWLTPAPANNTEMLAVTKSFSEENDIRTMEDFAEYVTNGGEVKLICSASFSDNPMGLLGYQNAYGFQLTSDQMIVLSHGNTAEMLKALYDGSDGVNVSLVYGTDGSLQEMDMLVLKDSKNVPPVYLPAPVLRGEVAELYPELRDLFTDTFESLDLETLQSLNARVAFGGEDAKIVAEEYLKEKGLLD
ncbi:glycine betaine ABC transporter substrate-binding protein [Alkalibacter mobilis]|uniref:glycine betaine ABC transporter substrate-binding protein n=1 Tax=Alkalibacter mobilis TaxID=2787712 RepID=UPI00189DD2DD|nr:glycine betaine ABC transporter substrate-binding protein [Alkalibacter mobilis]MBF7097541.1 ABC transporter substrate-binding protein [Alkalibacter mobilis]